MTNKLVYRYPDIKNKILNAVDTLADPIRQTVSPKGGNVIYTDEFGNVKSTNDGATIAKSISVKDPVEDAVINIIKSSSLKTNNEVGDGTSTSIILSQIMIKEGFKLIDNGLNPMDIKRNFDYFGKSMVEKIKAKAIKVKNDADILNIATVSANNDKEISKDVVKAIKVAGLDGMVFIEPNSKNETSIIEDVGFFVDAGMFSSDFKNSLSRFTATYYDVPVLVTDKRIYYKEEAETILKTVLNAGYKSVVIVARDFIGESVNVFSANHLQGYCKVLLVKDPKADGKDNHSLEDLAIYLDGDVVTEKNGKIVDNLSIDDFCWSSRVFSDSHKTLISPKVESNSRLRNRIKAIRDELSKDKDNESIKKRLAALTNGMVTIKVGGSTPIQINEKIFRFEDAINAVRAAMKDGYLVGGGISVFNSFSASDYPAEYQHTYRRFCEANIRQIAENCGKHPDTIIAELSKRNKLTFGYNAITDKIEDLLVAGIVDPYKVTEMAILNSISVANEIISSNYLIVNDIDKDE